MTQIENLGAQFIRAIAALLAAVIFSVALTSCASQGIQDYATEKPILDLKTYFNGRVDAWGMFQDRSGKVVKRFTVVMICTWQGDTGVLDETFTYSDGTSDKRVWTIKKQGDRYIGTAADVVGEASGQAQGNALRWNYTLALKVDNSTYNMAMDDWMYLIDEKTMINKTAMSKFGVYFGDVTLFFRK
jgi:hypothetical protein